MDPDKRIPSEGELLHAIQTGGEQAKGEAADELCRRHDPSLLKSVAWYLRDKNCDHVEDHASDVVDSAWVNILRHVGELKDLSKFKAWSRTIARNEANAHLTNCINGRNTSVELKDETLPKAQLYDYYTSKDAAIDAARMLKFAESISPPDFALVFRLYIVDELSFEDIAKRLGENIDKIRSIYYRGRRQILDKFGVGKDGEE